MMTPQRLLIHGIVLGDTTVKGKDLARIKDGKFEKERFIIGKMSCSATYEMLSVHYKEQIKN
jgi:hypothetical protein